MESPRRQRYVSFLILSVSVLDVLANPLLSQPQQGVRYPETLVLFETAHGFFGIYDMQTYLKKEEADLNALTLASSGWMDTQKGGYRMDPFSDVIYKNYTIKLRSSLQPVNRKWEPFAMVWSNDKSIGHPISSGELQDTEALANGLVLERAKAWVDVKEKAG